MALVHPGSGDELGVLRRTTRRLVYHPLRRRPAALPRLRAALEPELEHVPGAAAEATRRLSERKPRHEVDAAQGSARTHAYPQARQQGPDAEGRGGLRTADGQTCERPH